MALNIKIISSYQSSIEPVAEHKTASGFYSRCRQRKPQKKELSLLLKTEQKNTQ
jgi:hypothetical protein